MLPQKATQTQRTSRGRSRRARWLWRRWLGGKREAEGPSRRKKGQGDGRGFGGSKWRKRRRNMSGGRLRGGVGGGNPRGMCRPDEGSDGWRESCPLGSVCACWRHWRRRPGGWRAWRSTGFWPRGHCGGERRALCTGCWTVWCFHKICKWGGTDFELFLFLQKSNLYPSKTANNYHKRHTKKTT